MINGASQEKLLDDIFNSELNDIFSEDELFKDDPDLIYESGKLPVDIIEFIESPEFLGLKGRIYRKIKEALWQIEKDSCREAYLLLGKGSGKTTALQIYLTYGVYKVLMLKDPQKFYKLLPGDPIVVLLVSVSEKQAKEVGFAGVLNLINRSPWFYGKYRETSSLIRFPKNVTLYSGHSGATSWLGYNTLRGAMDEAEWMTDNSNRSVARELYRALKGSLNTRFPDNYKLLCISSVKNEYSFLHSLFKTVKEEGNPIDIEKEFLERIQ